MYLQYCVSQSREAVTIHCLSFYASKAIFKNTTIRNGNVELSPACHASLGRDSRGRTLGYTERETCFSSLNLLPDHLHGLYLPVGTARREQTALFSLP